MRVYLAPIIIVALLIAAVIFFVSCSTGFRGSIGTNSQPTVEQASALALR